MAVEASGIGERIKALREAKRLSIIQLASKSGIGENALRKVESGENKAPSFVTGVRIARALGVDPWYIAFGEGSPSNVVTLPGVDANQHASETRFQAIETRLDDLTRLVQSVAASAAVAAEEAAKLRSQRQSAGTKERAR